jgi:hypothetical protein
MKKNKIFLTFSLVTCLHFLISSCNNTEKKTIVYKYKIEGLVKYHRNGQELTGPAIAYTDTIFGQTKDSIWYFNTNGSKVNIIAPYKVYDIK